MSSETEKTKKSLRRHETYKAIQKQIKIAKSKFNYNTKLIEQPHRLAKHHAIDCGQPQCFICGNPRKTHKDTLTKQEKIAKQKDKEE